MDEWNKHIPRSSQEAASHCACDGQSVEEEYVLWQSDVGYRLDVFYRSFLDYLQEIGLFIRYVRNIAKNDYYYYYYYYYHYYYY